MPKDDERKEMTQEEIDAREEKFRTFFTTSVAQVPEEMTRRDDENEEKPKSLLGRLFRREKGEQQEGGTPEESRTGEIQLGGEEPEEPSDLELVLALEEEVAEPKPEQRVGIGLAHPVDDAAIAVGDGVMRLVDHQQVQRRHRLQVRRARQRRHHSKGDMAGP